MWLFACIISSFSGTFVIEELIERAQAYGAFLAPAATLSLEYSEADFMPSVKATDFLGRAIAYLAIALGRMQENGSFTIHAQATDENRISFTIRLNSNTDPQPTTHVTYLDPILLNAAQLLIEYHQGQLLEDNSESETILRGFLPICDNSM